MPNGLSLEEHAFFNAAASGNLNLINELLEKKLVDINAQDAQGKTALHVACREGKFDVVTTLVGAGAKLDIKDTKNFGVSYYAATGGNKDVITYIENQVNQKSSSKTQLIAVPQPMQKHDQILPGSAGAVMDPL